MKKKFIVITLILLWTGLNAQEDRAHEKNEYFLPISKVYTDKELIKLDTNLSELWNAFYTHSLILMEKQKEWVEIKNRCKDKVCIKEAYKKRILYLKESLDNQKTYPKEVLNGIADSLDMQKSKYYYTPGIKESMSKEFLNAFFTFKMSFKKPLIKNVFYSDKKLKEYLGDCYSFRFDKYVVNINNADFAYKLEGMKEHRIYSLLDVMAKDKEYYILERQRDKNDEFGTIFLLNSKDCKQVKEEQFQKDLNNDRFENILFLPEKCKDLNTAECELTQHRKFYIQSSNPADVVIYKNMDYLFRINWIKDKYVSLYIRNVLDKNKKFNEAYIFDIKYKKGTNNGN